MKGRTEKDLCKHKEAQKRAQKFKEAKVRHKKEEVGEFVDKSKDNQRRKQKGGRPLAEKPLVVQNASRNTSFDEEDNIK